MARRWAGWIALGCGLILTVFLHTSVSPPMFEGVPPPPLPYRYVHPPPDQAATNQPPLPGEATWPVQNGEVQGGTVVTGDNQVFAYFGLGALRASGSAQSVMVRIDPVNDPTPPQPGSEIRGNVYRISATAQPAGGTVTMAHDYRVTMRYPLGPFKTLQLYDGSMWHPLPTTVDSATLYASATVAALGELAATAQPPGLVDVLLGIVESYGLILFIGIFGAFAVWQEIRRRRLGAPSTKMSDGKA